MRLQPPLGKHARPVALTLEPAPENPHDALARGVGRKASRGERGSDGVRPAAGGAKQDTPGPSRSLSCLSIGLSKVRSGRFRPISKFLGLGGKKRRSYVEICFGERAGLNNPYVSGPRVSLSSSRGPCPPEPPTIYSCVFVCSRCVARTATVLYW